MTMIAFATYGDRAEFITDTLSYHRNGANLGRTSKHLCIPHLDAAILMQGDSWFGDDAKSVAVQVSRQVATFDELVESAPAWLGDLWKARRAQVGDTASYLSDPLAILVGWSDREQEFAAYTLAAEQEFKPLRIKGTWAIPCPWTARPSGIEQRRILALDDPGTHEQRREAVDLWRNKPPLARPAAAEEWRELAKQIRKQRALETFCSTYIGGDVLHTRLERGRSTTEKIHAYDDSGEEFLQMIAWSYHPIAQAAACWCESGKRYVDCHLAEQHDQPCACGSGGLFKTCCKV